MTRNLSDHPPVSATARAGRHRRPPLLVIPDYQGRPRPASELAATPRQEPRAPQPSTPSRADLTLPTLPVQDSLDSDCTPTRPVERMFAATDVFNIRLLDAAAAAMPETPVDERETVPTVAEPHMPDGSSMGRARRIEAWFQRTGNRVTRLATAADPMRRLMQQLPHRSTFGWQRTILLIVGGAVLAFGITGGGRREPAKNAADARGANAGRPSSVGAEIQRMTRAPLRVERDASPATTPRTAKPQVASSDTHVSEPGAGDPIFRMPVMGHGHAPPLQESVDMPPSAPAASQPARASSEPPSEFPKMAAPDGSAVTRRGQGHPHANLDQVGPAARQPVVAPRETLAESNWGASERPSRSEPATSAQGPDYPHTDPATYRDPVYEVPIIANREQDRAR